MEPLLADRTLAARIEASVVRDLWRYAEACVELDPTLPMAGQHIAGGLALYIAPGSPVNMLFGAGFEGPASVTDVEAAERFFAERGTAAAISLSPLADEGLVSALAVRGWRLTDFEHVLVRRPGAPALPPASAGIELAEARTPAQRAEWARISAGAFDAPEQPSAEVVRLGDAMAVRDDTALLTASIEGQPAGTGALWLDDGLAWILGDATLPALRGHGAQSALLAERIRRAQVAGAELVVSEARPGSISQRNHERLGFRVVYTRVELISPQPRR